MRSPRLIGRACLVLFCVWHLLAIGLTQLPITTAFGDLHYRIFGRYLSITGTWQHWGMFSSRPYSQTLDLSLRAYPPDSARAPVMLGPILPGFQPIGRNMRLEYLFLMGVTGLAPFLDDYLTRACTVFEAARGWKPKEMGLQVRYGYTRAFSNADPGGKPLELLDQEYRRVRCL